MLTIIKTEEVPSRLNTLLLQKEIAEAIGVEAGAVEISLSNGGDVITYSSEQGLTVDSVPRHVEVLVDGEIDQAVVLQVISDHVPTKTEEEERVENKENELKNHPVIRELIERIERLEGKK